MADEAVGQAARSLSDSPDDSHLHDRIKMVAYELWQQEGMPEGRAMAHWDAATRQVLGEAGRGDVAPPAGRVEAPVQRPTPNPRKEVPGLSADAGGTPSAAIFNDTGRG